MISVVENRLARVSQGDIYRDVEYLESVQEKGGDIEISTIRFPLVVVLTQDCDLAQDFTFRAKNAAVAKGLPPGKQPPTQDKYLISVLVAPIYNEAFVLSGEHLIDIGLKMEPIVKDSTQHRYLRQSNLPRYHYLEFPEKTPIPPSVIDFKHYFAVNRQYLDDKAADFVCRLDTLYREDVCQRFSSFLSRIGLPDRKQP